MDRIVIETDAPFCAPVPYRGKTCEPAMVIETARVLAQIKNLQIEDLENILFENTKKLYPKIKLWNKGNVWFDKVRITIQFFTKILSRL